MSQPFLYDEFIARKILGKTKIMFCIQSIKSDVVWCSINENVQSDITSKRHRHTFYEIHHAVENGYVIEVNEQTITLNHGDFVVISPQTPHKITSVSKGKRFVVGLTIAPNNENVNYINNILSEIHENIRVYSARENMPALVELMLITSFNARPAFEDALSALLTLYLLEIFNLISPTVERTTAQQRHQNNTTVNNAMKLICENSSRNITPMDLAQQIHISTKQLSRLFLQQMGITLSKAIKNERIKYIKSFLEHTDLPLREIAERTGFSDEFNLNRFFNRIEGLPPGKYRKSLKR